jgi:hypothetical protein
MIPVGFPPSRRSRELAHELFRVIREFRMLHPDIPDREILTALRIVEMEAGSNRTRNLILILTLFVILLCVLTFYLLISQE